MKKNITLTENDIGTKRIPNKVMFKNALISVSNKKGLVEFIQPLAQMGMRVVSTGGTAGYLKKAGISVVEIGEQTGFDEVMDGRVKSLHPRIYMPLLARSNHIGDQGILEEEGLSPFDLVVCNLYPFREKVCQGDEGLVEWIDIGGPSLLRAAAKNFEQITVLCDPADYESILNHGKIPDLEERRQLAGKVFSVLADYNNCIAEWLQPNENKNVTSNSDKRIKKKWSPPAFPSWEKGGGVTVKGQFYKTLRYGENPDQKASWFKIRQKGLQQAMCLQGKELSFNNICDVDAAVSVVREFQSPCSVAIKHNNPCGAACGDNMEEAVNLALQADPISVFGAVVAVNRPVSEAVAQAFCSLFLEAVIAPDYSPSALTLFQYKKKNLRVMKWPELVIKNQDQFNLHCVDGGILVQESQKIAEKWGTDWKSTGAKKPDSSVQSELLMAWKICAHLKSNAIALVSKNQTVGLGMGQVDRISAVKAAIQRWKNFHSHVPFPVMASDGFFPFPDSIEEAAKSGIKWIIQPGGSLRDQKIISKAKALSVNMVLTGQRCFSH